MTECAGCAALPAGHSGQVLVQAPLDAGHFTVPALGGVLAVGAVPAVRAPSPDGGPALATAVLGLAATRAAGPVAAPGAAPADIAAMLSAAPDLSARYTALMRRVDEASPYYSLRPTTEDDGTTVIEIVPKTVHIPTDQLITITGQVTPRKDDPEHVRLHDQLDDVIRFGSGDVQLGREHLTSFTVAAPAGLGIASSDLPDMFRIGGSRPGALVPPFDAAIAVRTQAGLPAASLPVRFTERSAGTDGGYLYGADTSGMFRVRVRLDVVARRTRLTMTFDPPDQALPSAYLPVLSLMGQMLPGRTMELVTSKGGQMQSGEPVPTSHGLMPAPQARRWAEAFNDFASLQQHTGLHFPVPDDFTLADARDVRDALALLRGEKLERIGATVSVGVVKAEAFDHLAAAGRSRLAARYSQVIFDFSGNQIDLGPMVETVVVDGVLNLPEARREFDRDGQATVHMRVAEGIPMVRYLGSELPT